MTAMLRQTVGASVCLAAISLIAAGFLTELSVGTGLAAGLIIGCSNGYMIVATLQRRIPFVAGSIFRMMLLTSTALTVAILMSSPAWAILLGVGAAQMVMAAAGVRQGLRS